jgi:uncharacterized protein (TIGR03083 family)
VDRDPKPWIAALRSSHNRLSGLVEPLVPDRVDTPSMATEWSIAQVLSHLGSQAEIFTAFFVAAIEGTELPGPDSFPPIWDAWNGRAATDQVSDSLAANAAFVDFVASLADGQLGALRFLMFGMDLGAVDVLQMRLSEHAVHTWDVAGALDPRATVSADAVELLLDTLPDMAKRVGKPQDPPFQIRVVTSDPVRDLSLSAGDPVEIGKDENTKPADVLRIPAEALVRLVYGRLDDKHTPPVELEGDLTLDRLRSVFVGL